MAIVVSQIQINHLNRNNFIYNFQPVGQRC